MVRQSDYIKICTRESTSLQRKLKKQYGPDVHIFERVLDEGPIQEITEEIRDDLRHAIRTYEQIVAALKPDAE